MKNFLHQYYPYLIASLLILARTEAQAHKLDSLLSDTSIFNLYDKEIKIVSTSRGSDGMNFLVVHDDENTGSYAAYDFLKENGGRVLELQYGNIRNINFSPNPGVACSFDPNRMFSHVGLSASLGIKGKPINQQEIIDSIRKLADTVLIVYRKNPNTPIVTLHNNTNNRFSLISYTFGQDYQNIATEIYINATMDPDDFIYVTNKDYFNYLRERDINVVLQGDMVENDGSLSIYAGEAKIPYINVEVEHGHLAEQKWLISVVAEMIQFFDAKKAE